MLVCFPYVEPATEWNCKANDMEPLLEPLLPVPVLPECSVVSESTMLFEAETKDRAFSHVSNEFPEISVDKNMNHRLHSTTTNRSWKEEHSCKTCNLHFDTETGLTLHSLIHEQADTPNIKPLPPKNSFSDEVQDSANPEQDTPQPSCSNMKCCLHSSTANSSLKEEQTCKTCNLHLNRETGLMLHSLMLEKEDTLNIKSLAPKISFTDEVKDRAVLEQDASLPSCSKVPEDFKEKAMLKNKKACACKVCHKVFTRKSTLNVHLRLHTGDRPHICKFCSKGFIYKRELFRHLRMHTGESPYNCDICHTGFTRRDNFIVHKRTHTGERPFACEFCPKTFTQNGDLKSHLRTHTGERPFVCTDCGRGFTHKGVLNTHLRMHTGERPFACSFCGKGFIQKGDLNTHLRVHTGERPFACEICNKSFVQKTDLKRHVLTHGGERPFSCDVCGKRFIHKGTLNNHIRTHTGERPYLCVICDKRFTERGSLRIHTRKKHPEINLSTLGSSIHK